MAVNAAIGSALVRRAMQTIGEGKQQGSVKTGRKSKAQLMLAFPPHRIRGWEASRTGNSTVSQVSSIP